MDTMVVPMSTCDRIAAENIRHLIDAKGTNKHALSRQSGIGYQTLSRKLDGGSLTIAQLERIAAVLEVRPTDLLKESE